MIKFLVNNDGNDILSISSQEFKGILLILLILYMKSLLKITGEISNQTPKGNFVVLVLWKILPGII